MPHTAPMPDSAAPAIDARTADGAAFELPVAPEGSLSLVFFYRGIHCPKCKDQIEELARREEELRAAGLIVSAVSMDDDERFARQQKEWDLGALKIGHAQTEESARAWGLYISDKAKDAEPTRFAEPAIYVLKPDNRIYALFVQNTPFARPQIDDLIQGLGFVMKNDYPVRGTA
ncbi:redoxin domain-containing protein [Falsirhodobacter algicola]|uniref:Redoxin domain-containing protein n=1 Tax=Falsirhodobacter algicola TaxID=2692330 RepID=A0A8J8SM46_9RHOB|nr:redoxin domain-containing protein [Falsirhodobacter algicola]QUS37031.1 redoxin domain-containing protein [Falsirhodobacter algicola]